MFEKLLVPVDGSDCSMRAAEVAAAIARAFSSEVTVLHVLYLPASIVAAAGAGGVVADQGVIDALEESGHEVVQAAMQLMNLPAEQVKGEVLHGHPADVICRESHERRCSLIVMGSRGLSEIRAFVTGSVSDKVNHHATCSVLIVR